MQAKTIQTSESMQMMSAHGTNTGHTVQMDTESYALRIGAQSSTVEMLVHTCKRGSAALVRVKVGPLTPRSAQRAPLHAQDHPQ